MAGDECLACGQKFKQRDAAVKCTVCGLWAHKKCSGLTDEFFKCIAEQFKASGRTYWACRSCNAYAEGMNHRLKELEEASKEAVRLGQENEKRIHRLEEEAKKREEKQETRVQQSENTVMQEMSDREARRKNVVVYGMEESAGEDGRQRT